MFRTFTPTPISNLPIRSVRSAYVVLFRQYYNINMILCFVA